jgi:nicotinate-nucleotide adenylyltransferase
MTMRLGVFGGTFDPPHRSHVFAVLWALQSGEVDRVLMVPTAEHAFGKQPTASFQHRLEMCRLAVREIAEGLVVVSDTEGRRQGTSYMVDTLRALEAEHPGAPLRLIVGSDILGEMHLWREPEEVKRLAPLLIVPRLGHADGDELGQLPRLSSTDVRRVLEAGDDASHLVPHRVLEYIRAHGLYSAS